MTNTPTREHREATEDAVHEGCRGYFTDLRVGMVSQLMESVAQALADAEQRGYERGLANRDERCLQSDMQRIREKLAFERGREAERAEVVSYLYSSGAAGSARAIETGSHLAKGE